jgi:hypothetical protein
LIGISRILVLERKWKFPDCRSEATCKLSELPGIPELPDFLPHRVRIQASMGLRNLELHIRLGGRSKSLATWQYLAQKVRQLRVRRRRSSLPPSVVNTTCIPPRLPATKTSRHQLVAVENLRTFRQRISISCCRYF